MVEGRRIKQIERRGDRREGDKVKDGRVGKGNG